MKAEDGTYYLYRDIPYGSFFKMKSSWPVFEDKLLITALRLEWMLLKI